MTAGLGPCKHLEFHIHYDFSSEFILRTSEYCSEQCIQICEQVVK